MKIFCIFAKLPRSSLVFKYLCVKRTSVKNAAKILTTFHLDTVNIEFVEVLVSVIGNTGGPPDVEVRHLIVPGTVASVPLTYSEGFPAQMIFREQLICILIVIGVGKQIHPRTIIEHTVSVADAVGNQLGLN